jgi:hypothetical protein
MQASYTGKDCRDGNPYFRPKPAPKNVSKKNSNFYVDTLSCFS